MSVRTSAGSVLSVSASRPGSFTIAGYAALSYAPIGEITNLGEFGRVYNLVTHNPIGSRGTVKKKGSFNEGQMALQLGLDTDDAGQLIMDAASASDNDYSFELVLQNGDTYYFSAQVMSFRVNVGSVDSITSAACTLELTTSSGGVGVLKNIAHGSPIV